MEKGIEEKGQRREKEGEVTSGQKETKEAVADRGSGGGGEG